MGTTGHVNMFNNEHGDTSIVDYVDLDYVGDMHDERSTTWYVFTLGG